MPEKWYPSSTTAHDLIRRLLPEMWSKVTIIKRALHPAQLTSDLSEMSRSRTQETQRSFLMGVASLKTEIGGYYVQRISLSFKDWRLAASCCFDFLSRTPPWNDQMTSASTSRSVLGFIQVRGHQGESMDSGPSSQGDLANSIISGFMFSGETGPSWPLAQGSGWSTITIWKRGSHGGCWDQSWPWENAASQMPFFSQGSEFYRALVPFLLCTEPFFFFYMKWFLLTSHTIQVRVPLKVLYSGVRDESFYSRQK